MAGLIDATEARASFSDLTNKVAYGKERIVISRKGKRLAAMVPIEDLELLEALEDKADLAAARKALKEPGTKSWERFKKERGL
jgi:prevent-host-death family protein